MSEAQAVWYAEIPRNTRVPALFGAAVLFVSLVVFGYWAYTAPIAGAVVSKGTFVSKDQNKIVQHLEGGVIREILVREGDTVTRGQVMVVLDDTAARAELRRLTLRRARLLTVLSRLDSEARQSEELHFPASLTSDAEESVQLKPMIEAQTATFQARQSTMKSELAVLAEGINALQERIEGSTMQLRSVREQLALIDEELGGKTQLLQGGMIRKPEVLALQRARANLTGELGRLTGDIGDAKERIARAREQMLGVKNNAVKLAVETLNETQAELHDVNERIRSAQGILNRTQITAPVDGVVVKLRYHTAGGVVEAGKSVMEIVPSSDELIIEAPVRPQDIDHVKLGYDVMVRLTTLSRRTTPMLFGKVTYISADALPNEKRGAQLADSYIVRISLGSVKPHELDNFVPSAGMPAEVYIKTAERSFLEYISRPVKDSMARAFREP